MNLDFPSCNFDVIDGVTYRIDPFAAPKYGLKGELLDQGPSRIVDLMFDGKRIDPAQRFVVARRSTRRRRSSKRRAPIAT